MAARNAKTLPSDPEYLLSLMSQIGDDSESDDEFDGWLDDDHRERDDETGPAPPMQTTPSGPRPDCRVCSDRKAGERHQNKYRCKGCKTPLCPYPCMERFHILKNYKIKY